MVTVSVFKRAALLGAGLAALVSTAVPAGAVTINLVDQGGVTGSASETGFRIAARYWETVLTNDVTVNFGVRYAALGTGIIGSTSSTKYSVAIQDVLGALADGGNSTLDGNLIVPTIIGTSAVLPTFGAVGTIGMTRNVTATGSFGVGQLSTTKAYDSNNTRDNATVSGTAANLKALGYNVAPATDANITFSTAFNFDFDPTNGITTGYMDFIGVAIHEMGHALGFTSGVDTYDAYLPNGPNGAVTTINWDGNTVANVLDLFRYSGDDVLDWSVGTPTYFSIDGGASVFGGDAYMSTGRYNGDGQQASHFKDTPSSAGGCNGYNTVGIMDPTFCYGQLGVIDNNDLAAMDAIGWNINRDVLSGPYTLNTAQIVSGEVPEPASWAMMVLGFGVIGAGLRRVRQPKVSFTA